MCGLNAEIPVNTILFMQFFQHKQHNTEVPFSSFYLKGPHKPFLYDLLNITLNIPQTENTALPSKNKLLRNVTKKKKQSRKSAAIKVAL